MPHAMQIRQTGGPEVLNRTAVDVGGRGSGQVRLRPLDCLRPRGLMVPFGQASGPIDPIAPVLRSQKGSLFLTRPFLFHYIERRDGLEASANELFEAAASGKVSINVNQHFALKDVAEAHEALEARATLGSTILTI
jgi:NADPH:quinone reductase